MGELLCALIGDALLADEAGAPHALHALVVHNDERVPGGVALHAVRALIVVGEAYLRGADPGKPRRHGELFRVGELFCPRALLPLRRRAVAPVVVHARPARELALIAQKLRADLARRGVEPDILKPRLAAVHLYAAVMIAALKLRERIRERGGEG